MTCMKSLDIRYIRSNRETETRMDTEQKERIISECKALMSKAKYDESKIEQFCHII